MLYLPKSHSKELSKSIHRNAQQVVAQGRPRLRAQRVSIHLSGPSTCWLAQHYCVILFNLLFCEVDVSDLL